MRLLLLCTMLLVAAAPSSFAEVLLKSDFSDGKAGWREEYGGEWKVVDGTYEGVTSSVWAGDKSWDNYRLSCRAQYVEGGEEGQFWLSFRYRDEWNRYAVAIRDGLLDEVMLLRYHEVAPPDYDAFCCRNVPLGFEPEEGEWYDVVVEAQGNRITVKVGDVEKPQITYNDPKPILSGAVALGGNYYRCRFDDVLVESLPPGPMSASILDKKLAPDAIKINFAPADAPEVEGYQRSIGRVYDAERGYGWDKDMQGMTKVRGNPTVPALLDSIASVAHGMKEATFRYDLKPGDYYVTVVGGDPEFAVHLEAYAEGDVKITDTELAAGDHAEKSARVHVEDGALNVRFMSTHPEGQQGLSVNALIIEPWDEVADREADRIAREKQEAKEESTAALDNEKRRQNRRAEYEPVQIVAPGDDDRTSVSLDGDWLFIPRHELEADANPASPDFPDKNWHILPVPNFWNQIGWWTMEALGHGLRGQAVSYRYDETRRTRAYTFDYAETTEGWYRQWIDLPGEAKGRRVKVKFMASASVSTVYINGVRVGDHVGMFTPFEFDLTDYVKWGEPNLLAVHVAMGAIKQRPENAEVSEVAVTMEVTNEMLNSLPKGIYRGVSTTRDYHYKPLSRPAGIWQPVTLYITKDVTIDNVFFKPRLDGADVDVTVKNPSAEDFKGAIAAEVAGAKVNHGVEVQAGASRTFTYPIEVENPKLWSPAHPNLYELRVHLSDANDEAVDHYECNVGFRTFETRGKDFYLNGEPRWMGGANMPPHGLRPNDAKLANEFFKLMHDGNQFITRAVCSPLTETWADASDRQGVAISLEGTWPWLALHGAELPDKMLLDAWRAEMRDLVISLRNHPSIVMWTVGNEFNYHPRHSEDKDLYVRKMKMLSDVIKMIRELDPTRPICAWSNYTREQDVYDEYLKPNNLDDGDITDPHRYVSWYQPGIWQDSQYGGKYIPKFAGQPIMSQEASTGYPNNDTGSPERQYIYIYVPQVWVGDDAYEHRDPAKYLSYTALVTKEWMEDVRRSRKTAGWIAFCNACWFQYASFADHITAYPAYEAAKKALAPVLVSMVQRDRHYFAGAEFEAPVVVLNDSTDGKDLTDVVLNVRLRYPGGDVIFEKKQDLPDCAYYGKVEDKIAFQIPDDLPQKRATYKLEFELLAGDRSVALNDYDLVLAERNWSIPEKMRGVKAALLGDGSHIRAQLDAMGVEVGNTLDDIDDSDLVIWSGAETPQLDSDAARRLVKYVEDGGVLILSEAPGVDRLMPEGMGPASASYPVEFVNIEIPQHPLFSGFDSQDVRWWNGNGKQPLAASTIYGLGDAPSITKLGECIQVHGYGWGGTKNNTVFEVTRGKGRILVSALRASTCRTDPLAARYLFNAIKWAAAEK